MAATIIDKNGNAEIPTLILQNRNFENICCIPNISDLIYKRNFNSANELSFTVYKPTNHTMESLWDSIVDFKVLYVPELNERFEIYVSTTESDTTKKSVTAVSLCEAELSAVKLYDCEINTEADILNPDYDEHLPTLFYRNPEDYMKFDWTDSRYRNYSVAQKKAALKRASLMHRLLEKAPHYSNFAVAPSLMDLQRTLQISDSDLYSVLTGEVSELFHCVFLFDSTTRTISAYDLYSTCKHCGYRGDYSGQCPKCGETDIQMPYGEDTTIFISKENLSTEINLQTNQDSLVNCFYVEGGDDIMTAAVRSVNPNGSPYIYSFSDAVKADMPTALSSALEAYDTKYQQYQTSQRYELQHQEVAHYNSVVAYVNEKFPDNQKNYSNLPEVLLGYPAVTASIYQCIDLYEFIDISMMPTLTTSHLGIEDSMQAILEGFQTGFGSETELFFNEIALCSHTTAITSTVERAIANNAKIFYSPAYYDFTVHTDTYTKAAAPALKGTWTGTFTLTSRSQKDETGKNLTLQSSALTLSISGNVALFTEQKIYRAMSDKDKISRYDITNRKLEETVFLAQLQLYSLQELQSLSNSFQGCLDILLSSGLEGDNNIDHILDTYTNFYTRRKELVDKEIPKRQEMLEAIKYFYYFDSNTKKSSGFLHTLQQNTNHDLNLEATLKALKDGEKLWKTFCSYRREDKYSNSNYLSDGLTNAQVIEHAKDLLEDAAKELYQASHIQYTLTATMNNLLALEAFSPLTSAFSVGNWIRLEIDHKIFKLRLLSYQINYEDFQSIDVEFSTTETIWSGVSDIKSILGSASSMAKSYSGVMQQMQQSKDASEYVKGWIREGLNAAQTKFVNSDHQELVIDHHGLLARRHDDLTDSYEPYQLKLLSNGLYTTSDHWKTIDTGIGRISYIDPESKELVNDYGIIAKTVVGKLFLGEKLGIYGANHSIVLDQNGITLDGGVIKWKSPIKQTAIEGLDTAFSSLAQNASAYTNSEIRKLDAAVANCLGVNSGTLIGSHSVISPFIAGGYLNITHSQNKKKVVIDPNGLTGSGYIFQVHNGSEISVGIKSDGSAEFKGTVHAVNGSFSGTITGSTIEGGNISGTTIEGGVFESMIISPENNNIPSRTFIEDGLLINSGYNANHKRSLTLREGVLFLDREDELYNMSIDAESLTIYKKHGGVFTVNASMYFSTRLKSYFESHVYMSQNVYFADGTDYYINSSGNAVFKDLSVKGTSSFSGLITGTITNAQKAGYVKKLWNSNTENEDECDIVFTTNYNFRPNTYIHYSGSNAVSKNATGKISLGTSSYRWKDIFADTNEIVFSDRNLKSNITPLTERHMDFFMLLLPVSFTFIEGSSGRTHIGFIAQDVEEAMAKCGFTDLDFAGFCKDVKVHCSIDENGRETEEPILDDNGNPEYIYSLRYSEFTALNTFMIQKNRQAVKNLQQAFENYIGFELASTCADGK